MAYTYQTVVYKLPMMGEADTLQSPEEIRFGQIIDRHLGLALKLFTKNRTGSGVIDEGLYAGTFVFGNSTVSLSINGVHPSISALTNSVFIYTLETLTWTALPNSATCYLYLTLVESTTQSSVQYGNLVTSWNQTGVTPANSILVAVATITVASISIDSTPTGKLYIRVIYDYDSDDDGVVDNSELLDGVTKEYLLGRGHHTGSQDWSTIITTVNKVSTADLAESERASLRFYEVFGDYEISGTAPSTSSNLTHTIPSQLISVRGLRIATASVSHSYTVNKDTYVDLDSSGVLHYTDVTNNGTVPAVYANSYRLFKVVTKSAVNAEGKVYILRRPNIGDTITAGGVTFTVVNTLGEVVAGNNKFWRGSNDTPTGWEQCKTSLVSAINSSVATVTATDGGASTVNITSTGYVNTLITTVLADAKVITVEGLYSGHGDQINSVVDLRRKILPYWQEPVAAVSVLPSKGIEGETHLVLDDNSLNRYDITPKYGAGFVLINSAGTPTHGDTLKIGNLVLMGTSGVESVANKEFSVVGSDHNVADSIKSVINSSTYPVSKVTALLSETTKVGLTSKEDESYYNDINTVIAESVAGTYTVSGISGAGEEYGWRVVGSASQYTTSEFDMYNEWYVGTSGQSLFNIHAYRDDTFLVTKNGLMRREGLDYDYTQDGSGIVFNTGCLSGDVVGFHVFSFSSGVGINTSASKDLSYVTVHVEPTLPNSLDLDNHSVYHTNINHDSVPISDPGTLYDKNKTYSILADHIYDFTAHMHSGGALNYPVNFSFLISEGVGNQIFDIQASAYKDFQSLIFENTSSAPGDMGEWEYDGGTIPWQIAYDSPATKINSLASHSGVIFAAASDGKVYKAYNSGLTVTDWFSDTVDLGNSVSCLQTCSGLGLKATVTNKIYNYMSGVGITGWTFWDDVPSTNIYCTSDAEDKLWVGGDGEVYLYYPFYKVWYRSKAPYVDVPVGKITAISDDNYNGSMFFGTENPARIYRQDVSGIAIVYTPTGATSVTDFQYYAGKLFASTNGLGKVYYTSGLGTTWYEHYDFPETSINALYRNTYDGYLYAGGTSGKTYRYNNVTWNEDYDFLTSNTNDFLQAYNLLYAGTGDTGQIWVKSSYTVGWTDVPVEGVDGDLYAGKRIRFILDDGSNFWSEGIRYVRYRQNSGEWEYAYMTDVQAEYGDNVFYKVITADPGASNQHFQVQVSEYKNFAELILDRNSRTNQTSFEHTTPGEFPKAWHAVPAAGIPSSYGTSGCKIRYTASSTLRFDKVGALFARWRQLDADGTDYKDWEYQDMGYVIDNYPFYKAPATASTSFDGLRVVDNEQVIDSVFARKINNDVSAIVFNVYKNSSPIFTANVTIPAGTLYQENIPDVTSLAENDVLTCSIISGDVNVSGISINVRAVEFLS